MDDLNLPGGTGGVIGTALAAIIGGGLMLRKWLSGESVDRAGNDATVKLIETLTQQLAVANARADQFAKERNEMVEVVGDLKTKIAELTIQVKNLQENLNAKST